ncbi:hypothetical protein [Streptomyces sp. NPDC052721]|uniref:hypothetical protein n=1 Tax=Streptomyces sp. NPDC052721 TaxID=3154955 RepID=UPI0034162681
MFAAALARGFDMPKEAADVLSRPALLDASDVLFRLSTGATATIALSSLRV